MLFTHLRLPAYHIYASPERFKSGPTVTADAASDTAVSIFPHPFTSSESGALDTAATDGDSSVATDDVDTETATVSWVADDTLRLISPDPELQQNRTAAYYAFLHASTSCLNFEP